MIEMSNMERILETVVVQKKNILINGGFEFGDLLPWGVITGTPGIVSEPVHTSASNYALALNPDDAVRQPITEYFYSLVNGHYGCCWLYGTAGDKVEFDYLDQAGVSVYCETLTIGASNTWAMYTASALFADRVLHIQLHALATNTNPIYVDDCFIQPYFTQVMGVELVSGDPERLATEATLGTRALESGGNLAALVTGINAAKWGGTAQTGHDLTDHITNQDVLASTQARLQPWYQPHFDTIEQLYSAQNIAPHAAVARWTYTVPASRIAMVTAAYCRVIRQTAATTAGFAMAYIDRETVATARLVEAIILTNGIGDKDKANVGWGSILKAGEKLIGSTLDLSSGTTPGTCSYVVSAMIMEFDT